ncbi:hypothetical protein CRYUN_Cryun34aG0098300 [Craigia yunnanensis]
MGKLVKHESRIDRLSGLPDSVLSHILSFLPTKYAVRTSILSTRWRYLSTSVTTLDFDNYPGPSDNFMNFVDRVLFFHDATSIERFRLRLRCGELKIVDYIYRICGWISFALRRRVKELDLDMFIGDDLDMSIGDRSGNLPPSLFTNKTPVKLVLQFPYSDFVMTVPTKVSLPSLKTLRLDSVDFVDDDSIRRLFSGCLVLEELVILYDMWQNLSEINISNPSLKRLTIFSGDPDDFDHHLNFVIDAPSLVDFKLSDSIAESYLLVNLHSLIKAHMEYPFYRADFNIASNLLKGISNVQSLCVTPDFLKPFTLCDKPIPVFHNLVRMEIYNGPYHFGEEIELKKFLESSPNLETLIFVGGAFESLTLYPFKRYLLVSCLTLSLNSLLGGISCMCYL